MEKSEALNPAVIGGNNSSKSTKKSVLSPEVESKWRQFRDFETVDDWISACQRADKAEFGKIKRYHMLRSALFPSEKYLESWYKVFIDRQVSRFTDMDHDRMAMICARADMSPTYNEISVDGHRDHAQEIFLRISGSEFLRGPLADCLGGIIVSSNSRPQTVYGYSTELPIVIVPSLENIWDLLVLIHELTHAIHIHISSDRNEIDRFVPDELVAETIANSFQFAALKYIADKWGGEIANHMWDMLLLFGLDDNVHYSKKKATLFGLVSMPYKSGTRELFDIMKCGPYRPEGDLINFLTGYVSERGMIEAGLKVAEAKISF